MDFITEGVERRQKRPLGLLNRAAFKELYKSEGHGLCPTMKGPHRLPPLDYERPHFKMEQNKKPKHKGIRGMWHTTPTDFLISFFYQIKGTVQNCGRRASFPSYVREVWTCV